MRTFELHRDTDDIGIVKVAEGVLFSDGTAVIRWTTRIASTDFYGSIYAVQADYCRTGKTRLVFDDGGDIMGRTPQQKSDDAEIDVSSLSDEEIRELLRMDKLQKHSREKSDDVDTLDSILGDERIREFLRMPMFSKPTIGKVEPT